MITIMTVKCMHDEGVKCDLCEGNERILDDRPIPALFDDIEEAENDEWVVGLSYRHDDHNMYDGHSKERSEARWADIKRRMRYANHL